MPYLVTYSFIIQSYSPINFDNTLSCSKSLIFSCMLSSSSLSIGLP
nr:MAG TPA: hypothetical protein [Caudoviricetes sp.]